MAPFVQDSRDHLEEGEQIWLESQTISLLEKRSSVQDITNSGCELFIYLTRVQLYLRIMYPSTRKDELLETFKYNCWTIKYYVSHLQLSGTFSLFLQENWISAIPIGYQCYWLLFSKKCQFAHTYVYILNLVQNMMETKTPRKCWELLKCPHPAPNKRIKSQMCLMALSLAKLSEASNVTAV